jgi:hypothetical protein
MDYAALVKCKGCGIKLKHPYTALSRFDNKTPVCPECGVIEASIQFNAMLAGKNPKTALRYFGLEGFKIEQEGRNA